MSKYKIGYTQGVFDMFHIGHLNLINRAKEKCDFLIVGVNSDNLVKNYKNKIPVVNENYRREIVANIKAVDSAIIVETLDKEKLFNEYKFEVIFCGDDWKNDERWKRTVQEMKKKKVNVFFLPYTESTSSTKLRFEIGNKVSDSRE